MLESNLEQDNLDDDHDEGLYEQAAVEFGARPVEDSVPVNQPLKKKKREKERRKEGKKEEQRVA